MRLAAAATGPDFQSPRAAASGSGGVSENVRSKLFYIWFLNL